MDGFKGAAEDEEGLKAQGRTQLTRPAAFFRNIILLPVVDRVRTSAAVFVVRALTWYGDALRSRVRATTLLALHLRTAELTNRRDSE